MNKHPISLKEDYNAYVLKTGEEGAQALNLQHSLMKKESYYHLEKAGLTAGQIVCDIGCGSGIMTEYFAKTVGKKGQVYALDVSLEQLNVTHERLKNTTFCPIHFIHADITGDKINNIPLPFEQADIVYSRLVLMHIKDPIKALKFMASLELMSKVVY